MSRGRGENGTNPPGDLQAGLGRRDFVKVGITALASPLLFGCGGDFVTFPPLSPATSRFMARPGEPTESFNVGLSELGITAVRGGQLYVPESYFPDTPAPLLVGLHGFGGSGQWWANYRAFAETHGMILLTPESRGITWDPGSFVDGPDVGVIDQALMHTFARVRIDPTRICRAGISDGASYTLFLGLLNGDLLTHLIAYSPGFLNEPKAPMGKPRVYISHGNVDTILPVTNTRNRTVPKLRNDGHEVTYFEFDGGHYVPSVVADDSMDWFLDR